MLERIVFTKGKAIAAIASLGVVLFAAVPGYALDPVSGALGLTGVAVGAAAAGMAAAAVTAATGGIGLAALAILLL